MQWQSTGVRSRSTGPVRVLPVIDRSAWLLLCGAFATGISACDATKPLEVEKDATGGIHQVLDLSDAEPHQHDTILIRSAVHNASREPVDLVVHEFCLEIGGTAELADPAEFRFDCETFRRPLLPGDSLVEFEERVVLSPPGTYSLQVRQLVSPDVEVEVELRVRG